MNNFIDPNAAKKSYPSLTSQNIKNNVGVELTSKIILLVLVIFIFVSGCVEESKDNHSNESMNQETVNIKPENYSSTALTPKEESIPEIEITSFSSIYMHDNNEKVYDYLFSWENVPGSENQGLISYLRDDQDISREHLARMVPQVVKSGDNKTIRVNFTSSNSTELRIEGNVLRIPNVELKVRDVNGKYKVLITPQTLQNDKLEGKEVNGKLCIYKVTEKHGYNLTKRYYAIYGLSIKNNGLKDLDFKLNELNVRNGDNIFNPTIEPYYRDSFAEVLSDLEKETKLEDKTLSPGQIINGSVVFQVNSLYDKSFLMRYNETPVTSVSFDKSIEALSTAERYNYSAVFGIPPYNFDGDSNSFEPNLKEYPYIWANWVNRSIFEVFNKADTELYNKEVSEYMAKSSKDYLPETEFVYALRVIPERNITLMLKRNIISYPESYPADHLIVIDDTGEELINSSRIRKIAFLKNQTYELHSVDNMDIPQMNFSNVTIVKISFYSIYHWARMTIVDQDEIMDEELNIIAARNWNVNAIY